MASFRPVCTHFLTGTCRFGAACNKYHVSSETIGKVMQQASQINQLQQDYGKLVEDGDLADVVFVVEGERFPAYRGVLAARSEYFRGLFKSGMQDGGTKEVPYEDVSAYAFRVLLRFLYTGELPARGGEELRGQNGEERSSGVAIAGVGKVRGGRKGMEGAKVKDDNDWEDEDEEEEEAESEVQELLKVADRFQAEGLYKHCLHEFGRALTVQTAIQQLVWAHSRGPAGAREVALQYVTANRHAIQVAVSCLACSPCV